MVDVQRRVPLEPLDDEVDELLERPPLAGERELAGLVAGPEGVERAVRLEDAEQVIEAVVEGVRIALDVEEEVVRRRGRQRREAALRIDGCTRAGQEKLVTVVARRDGPRAGAGPAPRTLVEGAAARPLEWRVRRKREPAEVRERVDAPLDERPPLPRRDPGDEAEVIVGSRRVAQSAAQRQTSQCSTGSG